ncbi:LysR family transcriptional regulator [Mesorhizobium sp. 10J20-29]
MDPLEGVAVFIAVSRHGSFSAAAEHLKCSKSTISHQMTKLERRVGARLMHRSTRAVTLTDAGRAYLSKLDDLMDRVQSAQRAAQAEATQPKGVLRLSAPAPFASVHIAPILPEFFAHHPDIRIDLQVTPEVVDLVSGGFDLAIRLCPNNAPSLVVRRLGASRIILVASPDFFSSLKLPTHPSELANVPVIVNASYPDRDVWRLERENEEYDFVVDPVTVTNCPVVLQQLACRAVGVAQISECNILDDLRQGRLVRILPDWQVVEVPVLAVYPDNKHIAVKVRTFVDFLARRLTLGFE